MVKRVMLDTNIYGRIVESKKETEIKEAIEKQPDVVIYGSDTVRKELRDVSKEATHGHKRLRLVLLALYDSLVKSHAYHTTIPMRELAYDYYKAFRELGGKRSEKEMLNDLLIIACASIQELDLVVSEDNKTMLSDEALRAYSIVNSLRKYRTPNFIGYEKFMRLFA